MADSNKSNQKKLKVLYQFLNGQWYAFAEGGDEVYFGRVPVNVSAPKDQNNQKAKTSKTPKEKSAKGK